jgi:hypothetical protein
MLNDYEKQVIHNAAEQAAKIYSFFGWEINNSETKGIPTTLYLESLLTGWVGELKEHALEVTSFSSGRLMIIAMFNDDEDLSEIRIVLELSIIHMANQEYYAEVERRKQNLK